MVSRCILYDPYGLSLCSVLLVWSVAVFCAYNSYVWSVVPVLYMTGLICSADRPAPGSLAVPACLVASAGRQSARRSSDLQSPAQHVASLPAAAAEGAPGPGRGRAAARRSAESCAPAARRLPEAAGALR